MTNAISALLHDIGKFYQRTGIWPDLTKFKKYLVFRNGKYLYYHAAYTGSFINTYIGNKKIEFLAASHHLPKESIIKNADIIASAHDRRDSDYDDSHDENYILMRLSSIFHLIGEDFHNMIVPLVDLSSFTAFKKAEELSIKQAKKEYFDLFMNFVYNIKKISNKNLNLFYHHLYPLVKEYLYCIPANTYKVDKCFVSLFDHLKLTTAVVNCLKQTKEKQQFAIIKYHLHGITDFVYCDDDLDLIYGRSAFIKLLEDFIVYRIIHEFGLTYDNILYAMGGQGRIIVPNNQTLIKKLNHVYDIIIKKVNIRQVGIINFVLSYDIYDENNLKSGKFKRALSENEKNLIKFKKFVDKGINKVDYYSIGKKIINNNIIIEYNFGKKNHNISDISFLGLGYINFNPRKEDDICYYQTYNGFNIGESKNYKIVRNYQLDNNAVLILMDIVDTANIITNKINKNAQSFSTFLTLSRTIELFFTRIVSDLCLKMPVNIIYTSGDDIVLITSSINKDVVIKTIIDGFDEFTSFNQAFKWKVIIEPINDEISQVYKKIKNK